MASINSVITYNANLSPAQAQIKALTAQVGALSAAFNTLDKSALSAQRSLSSTFAANVGQIGGFTAQTVKATDSVTNFGKQIAANRLTMREYFREAFTGYARQNSMLRQLAAQQVRYQQSIAVPTGAGQAMLITPQSINAASSAAALASQRFSIFNQLVNGGATAMLNWGKNTQWAGRQLMVGFTLPLALFVGVMSKQFRELDKELTRFQKVYGSDLGNAVSESTKRMRDQVQQLAYDISAAYGIAAKETAALAADIAATGAEGEKLMTSVEQTTRLAVLGEVDRQEAMKATLSLQSAFRLNTNELAESINFLNAVENQTSATLEDLSTAIPKVGPVIRSLGGDVKDLATLLVAMREGGIPAAEAANALKSGLASLINPTKQASEVAKQFGVDLVGIVEANRGQLMPTIYAMQEALGGLDSFSRSRIIEQIFGKYQFARISALFDNIGRIGSQTQSVIELASKSSAELAAVANGEIRTLTESTAVRFQRTLEQLKNSLMPIAQTLTETLIPVLEKVGEGVKMFSTFFSSLPDAVKNLAKWGVAITALAGPVIMLVGLFGNLIANGIKFSMMIVRLGARMAGIKTEKFQLLDEQVMAAKLGVDNLTASFTTQETAMKRLVGVLSAYEQSLRRLSTANPALFIPGAVPARGALPIKRQAGSTRPEFVPGSGRGDKIPAMLEPGEFIVNRAATEKYAPVLLAMNRGNLPGFEQGTTAAAHTSMPFAANTKQFSLALAWMASSAKYGKDFIDFAMRFPEAIKVVSKSVAILPAQLNQALKTGVSSKQFIAGWNQTGGGKFAPSAIQGGFDMAQKGAAQALTDFSNRVRDEAVRIAKATNKGKVNDEILAKAQRKVIAEIQQTASSQDPVQMASKNLAKAIETQSLRLGAVRILATQDMIQSGGKKFTTDAAGNVMYGNLAVRRAENRDVRYAAPRFLSGGIERDAASARMITAADKLSSAGVILSSAFGRFTGSTGALVGMPARGAGGGGYLTSGAAMRLVEKEIDVTTSKLMEKLLLSLVTAVKRTLESGSPSRRAERELGQEGKNLGDGAMIGLRNGFKSAVAGKQIIAGPVGGTGVESISNAQKIAQADQSILRLKTLQQKFTADRVRTEVELGALDARLMQIRNNETMTAQEKLRAMLALNQERIALEKIHQTALANETRIQNTINGYKQKIADADAAQLRSEQIEAQAAARRASTSLGIGPGGSSGWLMGGVSPYAKDKTPDWLRSRMDQAAKDAAKGRSSGPIGSLSSARQAAGARGGGVMNAAFMASMAMSSVAMLGGASSDAAMKIGLFSTALMTATMMMQSVSAKGMFTNFLGMGSLGRKVQGIGVAQRAAATAQMGGAAAARAAGGIGSVGAGFIRGGAMIGMLGGPVGIAAGLGITAAITAFMMYRKAAEEARQRAMAAFADPVKTAEYFGVTITKLSDQIKNAQIAVPGVENIDTALREAVQQDYGDLITKIKYGGAEAGAEELSIAFNRMIASGMDAESAKEAVKAISVEAGVVGGEAYSKALREGLLDEDLTAEERLASTVQMLKPMEEDSEGIRAMQNTLDSYVEGLDTTGFERWAAQNLNNVAGDFLSGTLSTLQNINPLMQGFRALVGATMADTEAGQMFEMTFDKDAIQQNTDMMAAQADTIHQMSTNIEENLKVTGDQLVKMTEQAYAAFQVAPQAAVDAMAQLSEYAEDLGTEGVGAIEEFITSISPIEGAILNSMVAGDEGLQKLVLQAISAGMTVTEIIEILKTQGAEGILLEIDVRVKDQEAKIALDNLKKETSEDLVQVVDVKIEASEKALKELDEAIKRVTKARDRGIKKMEEEFEAEQEGYDNAIENYQDRIDLINEEIEARRKSTEERIDGLEKEKETIEDASDAYIKSLQKRQKADSFYSQQRKTAISALQKLAAGDVFGFLQDREEMSANAQENAYNETITQIEEKRDRELEAIDETIEKERERQKEFEENQQKKIDLLEDEIDKINDISEARQDAHEQEVKDFEKMKDKKIKELQREKDDEQFKLGQLRKMRDSANAQEILSAKDLAETLGPELAKPYIEKQKEIIKGMYLAELARLKEEGATDMSPANRLLREMYAILVGQNAADQMSDAALKAWLSSIPTGSRSDNSADVPTGSERSPINRASGGKVSGPGGPKSDVIPALLSNGEYVVQASSVKKYGAGLMDSINAGKFADGGIVKAGNGTYISADRAETQASGGVYAGGWKRKPKYFGGTPTSTSGYTKPGPAYSGGTPTYSGGYTTTNRQAEGRGKKNKNNYYTRGGYSRGYGSGRAGSGFSLIGGAISESINQRGIWGMLSDMVSSIAADPRSLIPFYGLSSIDTSTQAGKDMLSATALMEILGVLPGIGVPFKAMSMAGRAGVRSALRPRTIAYAAGQPFDANEAAARYFPDVVRAQTPIKGLYSPSKTDPIILDESPSSPFAQASTRDSYLENIFSQPKGGQGGISPGGWVIGKDGVERYVKTSQSGIPQAAYSEVLTAKLYERLGFNVPNMSLLRLGSEGRAYKLPTPIKYRSDPFADDPSMFKPGSLVVSSDKLEFDPFGGSSAPEMLAREQGFGTAMDQWLHFTDMHPGNFFFSQGKAYRMDFGSNPFYNPEGYPSSGKLFTNQSWIKVRKEYEGYPSISPTEISDQWRVLSNAIQNRGGLVKLIQLISDDILGTTGIQLNNQSMVIALLEKRLREGLRLTENPENMSITTLPPRSFSGLYANGGLVQKFADGGMAGNSTNNRSISTRSSQPHARANDFNYSQNGWPYISGYGVAPLKSGKIPGTNASISTHKDVLPLFLALASEYNKKIRRIDSSQTAGFGFRNNKTNHRSGTAIDINYSDEGLNVDAQWMHDWWNGKRSSSAPWSSFSSNPARSAVGIKNYFNRFGEILEWYGSSKLGGDLIYGQGLASDWMHWQISQVTKPGPEKIKEITGKLGINEDGTFGEGSGDPTGPMGGEDRPNKGANGTGAGGRYMPVSYGDGRKVMFGRALPSYVFGVQFPGDGTTVTTPSDNNTDRNNNQDRPESTPGTYSNQYIKGAQLVKLLDYVGFKGPDLRTAYGVVMGESGGNRKAVNDNGGNKDWGLFQMNDYWNRNIKVNGKKADFSPAKIFDAVYNSQFARATTKDPGVISYWKDPWKDWNAYNNNTTWYRNGLKQFDENPQWRNAIRAAAGGFIKGPGGPRSDSIPAMLSNGEYVINSDSVRRYGPGLLDAINSGSLRVASEDEFAPEMKMKFGGLVGRYPRSIDSILSGGISTGRENYSINSRTKHFNIREINDYKEMYLQKFQLNRSQIPIGIGGYRNRPMPAPEFNIPNKNEVSTSNISPVNESVKYGDSVNNLSNVKIVINGADRKNAKSIANEVARMIKTSNSRRDHSRSSA